MLAACTILDQACDEAVLRLGRDHEGRHLLLAERTIGLQPSLSADELIAFFRRLLSPPYGNRPLEADLTDIVDHLPESAPAAAARIDDFDALEGDPLDLRLRFHRDHAAFLHVDRAARANSGFSVSMQ